MYRILSGSFLISTLLLEFRAVPCRSARGAKRKVFRTASVAMSELTPNYDQNQALGAIIQIVGSSISIIGLNAQKWAMDEQAKMDEAERARCCSSWRWTLAFLVFTDSIVHTLSAA